MKPGGNGNDARAVVTMNGSLWTANAAFCSLLGRDEAQLQRLGWRELVHASDRSYLAAHLVEVLAGSCNLREFDVRLVRADGPHLRTRLRVELVRDGGGRHGWFLVEAWATT